MALVRRNPAQGLVRIGEEMERLLQDFLRPGEGEEDTWMQGTWVPPVDIHETDDALVLRAELPGFTKEDISVELQDRTLILRGERKHETEVKEEQYHRRERAYGRFERVFWLPTEVDAEKVQANFRDGVLELRLPKSETAKLKRIAVRD